MPWEAQSVKINPMASHGHGAMVRCAKDKNAAQILEERRQRKSSFDPMQVGPAL